MKRINPSDEPFKPLGDPFDEIEVLPGPPKGANGLFTTYETKGAAGTDVAMIEFPWEEVDFRQKEPYFALLQPNLAVAWVDGKQPVLFHGTAESMWDPARSEGNIGHRIDTN